MDIEWFRSRWFPIAFAGAMFGLLVYLSHPQHPPLSRTSWPSKGLHGKWLSKAHP